jgi:hypothetical protein
MHMLLVSLSSILPYETWLRLGFATTKRAFFYPRPEMYPLPAFGSHFSVLCDCRQERGCFWDFGAAKLTMVVTSGSTCGMVCFSAALKR